MLGIYKVKMLTGLLKEMANDDNLDDNDLVFVTLGKITGNPLDWLQERLLKGDVPIGETFKGKCDMLEGDDE